MKFLVVYYSRTKTTQKVAEVLKIKLEADVEEILDLTSRAGGLGFIRGGKDAVFERPTRIAASQHNPENYDVVIIGTPVWAGTVTPAVRTYLSQNARYLKNVALFTTQGSKETQKVMIAMKKILDVEPLAELQLTTKEVLKAEYGKKLDVFIKIIKTNHRE